MHEVHEEKKKRFRALTKWFRQGLGRKLDRRRDFGEKKVFGSREIEIFEKMHNQVEP